MLFTHAPLLATVACLHCLSFSAAITAFAFSSRPAASAVKHSSANHIMSTTSTSLHYSINRRAVFTVVPVATFATLFIPLGDDATNEKYRALADEPNNVYYKSKADEEDPLAVFGRSLQQSIPTSTTDGNNDAQQQQGIEEQSNNNNKVTEELLPGGGDLGKALLEKQKERRIDPRTHG